MTGHEKIKYTVNPYKEDKEGLLVVDAIAPVILSVSRATDIPAFHAEWFNRRWSHGYCTWINPYSNEPQYVSFDNVRGIVFWTKNPNYPFSDIFSSLNQKHISYYVQYTLNDYEKEKFEPNLPTLSDRIYKFKRLSQELGKHRVIWRFDPLITTKKLTVEELTSRIENIGNEIAGYTDKLVFSFVDINTYKKVQNNLIKYTDCFSRDTIMASEFSASYMYEMAASLAELRNKWAKDGWNVELATCGEKVDLDIYNISHNRCVDADLFRRLAIENDDKKLLNYLDYGVVLHDNEEYKPDGYRLTNEQLKDKGQRMLCGCMLSKDIGAYNSCSHYCVYCYANASREQVKYNMQFRRDPHCVSLLKPVDDTNKTISCL